MFTRIAVGAPDGRRLGLGVAIMCLAAGLALVMNATGYPVIVFIIALFLGANFESSLSQSLVILDGDPRAPVDHPVALALLVLAGLSVWYLGRRDRDTGSETDTDSAI